jgi:hypothetical protein
MEVEARELALGHLGGEKVESSAAPDGNGGVVTCFSFARHALSPSALPSPPPSPPSPSGQYTHHLGLAKPHILRLGKVARDRQEGRKGDRGRCSWKLFLFVLTTCR